MKLQQLDVVRSLYSFHIEKNEVLSGIIVILVHTYLKYVSSSTSNALPPFRALSNQSNIKVDTAIPLWVPISSPLRMMQQAAQNHKPSLKLTCPLKRDDFILFQ